MITVFTSSYNHGPFLGAAIESVLAQSYQNFEYLLFDDGSTDNTWEVMQRYVEADPRITAVQHENLGVGTTINTAAAMAKGDRLVWLPADDMFMPDLLATQAKEPSNLVLHMRGRSMDGPIVRPSYPPNPIAMTGVGIPVETLREIPFPEHLSFSEDYFWVVRASHRGVPFKLLDGVHYLKRQHENSITGRHRDEMRRSIAAIYQEAVQ